MKQSTKTIIKVTAGVLAALFVVLAVILVASYQSNGQRNSTVDFELNHNEGMVVSYASQNSMRLTNLSATTQNSEGVTLSATILPETAIDKTVLWEISWKNPESEWASGKTIDDYVTISETTTASGESITVNCLKDFGEQVVIKAVANSDDKVNAVCLVDYAQKIKSLNYTFKYGTSSMTTPTADSDGVYRVDYTGEEKNYVVECVPVYTNYTIQDEFTKTVSGQFTDSFGYTASYTFTEIAMQAGLFIGSDAEGEMTENAQSFVDLIVTASKTGNFNALASMLSSASTKYNALTTEEKAHSRVVNAKQAMDHIGAGLQDGRVDTEDLEGAQDILNGYVAPLPSGDFTGGVHIESVDALLNAAKNCNNASNGIVEFTVTYKGTYSDATFRIELGYTSDSIEVARSMEMSKPSIIF